jgi:hypothetical protein
MGNRQRGVGCNRPDSIIDAPLPAEATMHLPGSDEKVDVLVERESRDDSLFHPDDAERDDDRSRPPEWRAILPDGDEIDGIFAISKSEARGILKGRLNLGRRRPLPVGTILERIPVAEVAAGDAVTMIDATAELAELASDE